MNVLRSIVESLDIGQTFTKWQKADRSSSIYTQEPQLGWGGGGGETEGKSASSRSGSASAWGVILLARGKTLSYLGNQLSTFTLTQLS